jgi:hypothetical protein
MDTSEKLSGMKGRLLATSASDMRAYPKKTYSSGAS